LLFLQGFYKLKLKNDKLNCIKTLRGQKNGTSHNTVHIKEIEEQQFFMLDDFLKIIEILLLYWFDTNLEMSLAMAVLEGGSFFCFRRLEYPQWQFWKFGKHL